MIRVLAMIAVAGFVLSVGSLMVAAAVMGPDAVHRFGWTWSDGPPWGRWGDWGDHDRWDRGPTVSRTFTWSGGETLSVEAPAEIRYVQQAGAPSLTISGPASALDRVTVEDGAIRLRGPYWRHGKLSIALTAPNVSRFDISSADKLRIEGYDQARLSLDISGAGEVTASGKTGAIDLDISGAGDADLGGLAAREADVEISGAAQATVAPTERARLAISGMGVINLLTHPPDLTTDISGAGKVNQPAPAAQAPAPEPEATPGKKI